MSFYLKYTNDNWATSTDLTVTTFIRNVKQPFVARTAGTNLNGTDYSHRLYKKSERLINISADFLYIAANLTYMKAFYEAGAWKYSDDGSTYVEVTLKESGLFPIEYIEGHILLPDLTFTLIDKKAS